VAVEIAEERERVLSAAISFSAKDLPGTGCALDRDSWVSLRGEREIIHHKGHEVSRRAWLARVSTTLCLCDGRQNLSRLIRHIVFSTCFGVLILAARWVKLMERSEAAMLETKWEKHHAMDRTRF
jgi:hypothetical protein